MRGGSRKAGKTPTSRRRRLASWGLALLVLTGAGWLLQPNRVRLPSGIPDYGPYFAHLRQLGLPDSRGYRYAGECLWGWDVRVNVTGTMLTREQMGLQGDHFVRRANSKDEYSLLHLNGNEASKEHGRLIAIWPGRLERLGFWIQGPMKAGDRKYHPADLAGDLQGLLKVLEAPNSRIWNDLGKGARESIMVLAAHAHRCGEEALANAVMHRWLNGPDLSRLPPERNQDEMKLQPLDWLKRPGPDSLMRSLSEEVVRDRIREQGTRLAKNWDWQAYRNDLAKIRLVLADMGHLHHEELLGLELLDQRLSGEVRKVVLEASLENLNREISLAGPEALPPSLFQGDYWLFRDWPALTPGDKPSPMEKLLRMGPAAIPLLQAWQNTQTEWPLALADDNLGFNAVFSVLMTVEPIEEFATEIEVPYNTPVTRWELSRFLLRPLEATWSASQSRRRPDGEMELKEIPSPALDRMAEWANLARDERIRYFREWDGLLLKVLAWDARLPGEGPATIPWREAFSKPPPGVLGKDAVPEP